MQHDGTRTRSYLIWLCVSFLIINNVLAWASPKPDTGTRLNSIPFVPGLNAQSHPEVARAEVSTELASKFIKKNSVVSPNSSGASATVSPKEVRVVYLVPSDRTIRQDYVSGIRSAIVHLQAFYQNQLGSGFAFSLHSPIVEVFQTSHAASFYSTGGNATQIGFWNSVLGDGFALSGGGFNDPNNRWIYYVDADPVCGQVVGGTSGVALLPANDLRGLTGQPNIPPCVGQPPDSNGLCRWVGGLGHELGHAFGLPHPPGCDQGNCSEFAAHSLMYLGYIDYPNTYFLDDDKAALLATGFFSVLSPLEFSPNCTVTSSSGGNDAIGVYFPTDRTFYLRNTNNVGNADFTIQYGPAGVMPIAGDWNGDGTTTIGVYETSTRTFYLRNSNTVGPADIQIQYGPAGAIPIAGDWNGDGTDTIGVYDPATQTFYLRNSNTPGNADIQIQYGPPGSLPAVGDFDGNGTDTIGVYETSTRTFYLRNSNTIGNADIQIQYGPSNSVPAVGDFDGNGTTTIGVYETSTRTFYLRNSNTVGTADITAAFGPDGSKSLIGDWDGL